MIRERMTMEKYETPIVMEGSISTQEITSVVCEVGCGVPLAD